MIIIGLYIIYITGPTSKIREFNSCKTFLIIYIENYVVRVQQQQKCLILIFIKQ